MKNKKVLLFSGTFEGRKIAEFMDKNNISGLICVATEYGREVMPVLNSVKIKSGRLSEKEIIKLIIEEKITLVIDGTHPYAEEVTKNIKLASEETKTQYYRVLRDENLDELNNLTDKNNNKIIKRVKNTEEAVVWLSGTKGKILNTTGSKELPLYCKIPDYKDRLVVRVLPDSKIMEQCKELGIKSSNIIGMQGPFSKELNIGFLNQYKCEYLVSKNTGLAGGFKEKIEASAQCGVKVVVIDRPEDGIGYSCDEIIETILIS